MLEVFGASKSHTTAYHPQGDGMVEQLNHTILQMLRCCVNTKDDWESIYYWYFTLITQ